MMLRRARRSVRLRIALSMILLVTGPWNAALADVLVLRSGARFNGTLANSDMIASNPYAYSYVSFLVRYAIGQPELLDFTVQEIDYILLESEDASTVIDFRSQSEVSRPRQPLVAMPRRTEEMRQQDLESGVGLVILGAGLGLLGIVEPFGHNETFHATPDFRLPVHEKDESYNVLNYLLMAGGAVSIIGGLKLITRSLEAEDDRYGVTPLPEGAALRTAWRF